MTDETLRNDPAAPVELVWSMWTEAEHFAAWYGPTGARIPVSEIDLRVGGGRRVCLEMDTPNGPMQMWFVGEYMEIVPNERLVYTEAMADEDGNVRSPDEMGMPQGHPTVTEVIVELEPVDDSTTKLTMTHAGVPADSGGAGGWALAFDKLATHLESVRG